MTTFHDFMEDYGFVGVLLYALFFLQVLLRGSVYYTNESRGNSFYNQPYGCLIDPLFAKTRNSMEAAMYFARGRNGLQCNYFTMYRRRLDAIASCSYVFLLFAERRTKGISGIRGQGVRTITRAGGTNDFVEDVVIGTTYRRIQLINGGTSDLSVRATRTNGSILDPFLDCVMMLTIVGSKFSSVMRVMQYVKIFQRGNVRAYVYAN